MHNLWDAAEAAHYTDDLHQRVYTSRLLGREQALVLHGGGNTSVKSTVSNIFGEDEPILYVKGSGWDLATIEAAGFAPVRMQHLLRLAQLETLSDAAMARELKAATIDPSAPAPSVEAILHAILPYKFVDHTHADAVVAITNTPDGRAYVEDVYGDSIVIVPYIMPGFALARHCAEHFPREAHAGTIGMLLMNHGIFSFGATAHESYDRMIALVSRAEAYLQQRNAWHISLPPAAPITRPIRDELALLRSRVCAVAGFPLVMTTHDDERSLGFARHPDIRTLAQQGPLTPDHVIRTRRVPLIGRDVQGYRAAYEQYFAEHAPRSSQPLTMLDPAPRVILDAEFGLCVLGRHAQDAAIVYDIYSHTIENILRATALGGYRALDAASLFEVEYWDLEQAKLKRQGAPPEFAGEVALVTGAASGIGRACAETLLKRGAAVVGLDINPEIEHTFQQAGWLGVQCDITNEAALFETLEKAVRRFGGLDMLILNAGIFSSSRPIADLTLKEWQGVLDVNLNANVTLLREAYPLLKLAPRSGRVVVIGTRNVAAPGKGAAAYSVSKAALTQLARVATLEWSRDNIRVNMIHPDAVFDTAIWTDEVLQSRAAAYGMTVEAYKSRNLLRTEVSSYDVAAMAAAMCGSLFAKTTGAQVPLDGGNERVV
ncbi:MAG: bifunctional aldolase/short-chain dehydrogenase [Chloroflexaceae bacterium]|nr:bifunctional aldolase/short-chain dehydrogenase [Chloroflexaceae bacterium]